MFCKDDFADFRKNPGGGMSPFPAKRGGNGVPMTIFSQNPGGGDTARMYFFVRTKKYQKDRLRETTFPLGILSFAAKVVL